MKPFHPLWLLLVPLLFAPACSHEAARDLPVTMTWDKDQELIAPAGGATNVWEGFRVDEDAFTAEKDDAQFILWRARTERVPLFVEYSLQGRPVQFSVNVRKKLRLPPASSFRREKLEFRLNRGLNFLRFSKTAKDKLRVRAIAVGRPQAESPRHLRRGEAFALFHRPGRGRIALQGRGRLELTLQRTDGGTLPAEVVRLRGGGLTGRVSHSFEFSTLGVLRVKATEGSFDVRSYRFDERPPVVEGSRAVLAGTPNIYIILSDACQASHLGTYGYGRSTSPQIDAFARDAVVYENAYTNAVFTRSSVGTLLTGLFPDTHKTRVLQAALPSRLLTLPEYLKPKGYRSCIITSTFGISTRFGFTQGVDNYFRVAEKAWAEKDVSIYQQLRDWLKQAPAPHFCYMHYIHPHFPKVPPPDFPVSFLPGKARPTQERMAQLVKKRSRTGVRPNAEELQEITDIYDSSVAWVDSEVGKILALLKERGDYDDSIIVFLADHGEALGEHRVLGHGGNVYEETSRVPLIIKYPRSMALRGRVNALTELADVFPTVASLFGQRLTLDGRILPLPGTGGEMDDHMVVSRTFNRCPIYGLRWRNWYYIIDFNNSQEELFSLAPDADPLREVGARFPAVVTFLRARFLDWYGRFRNQEDYSVEVNLKNLPAREIEEMKTLGYL
ncbi:MAG: sulfatase [Candidatus Aminicenantes bacterium]|nr:sulfatase [Candidatus Aminicenantes bacterium]